MPGPSSPGRQAAAGLKGLRPRGLGAGPGLGEPLCPAAATDPGGLGNIQKVRDGEPLGGKTDATKEFDELPHDELFGN